MASFIKMAVVLAALVAVSVADDCSEKCTEEIVMKQAEELWEFLARENPKVLPGELAAVEYCKNCIEKNRKKRRIEEGGSEGERKREERSPGFFGPWWHASEERNKCPLGYRRVFRKCLKLGI